MRENLETIDWSNLKTVHGFATEVPTWIRQLASSDIAIRQEALEELSSTILHQGSIYEVTSYVVMFLIELLTKETTPDKDNLLGLLSLIMVGNSVINEQNKELLKNFYEQKGLDFYREVELGKQYVEKARHEVSKGLPVYMNLLNNEISRVRMEAACLLSFFPKEAFQTMPAIQSRIAIESEEEVKASLVWYLGDLIYKVSNLLDSEKKIYAEYFGQLLGSSQISIIKFASAISHLKVAKHESSDQAVSLVIKTMSGSITYPTLPWGGVPIWDAGDALCELDSERRAKAFEQALVNCSKAEIVHDIVITWLTCIFVGKNANRYDIGTSFNRTPDGAKERIYTASFPVEVDLTHHLTLEQKLAVRIVADCQKFWEIRNNLLEVYGLPTSREKLHSFINQN